MKYLDAEKLEDKLIEIEKRHSACCESIYDIAYSNCLTEVKLIISSLLKEQISPLKGKFIFPKFLYARTTNNKTLDVSYVPQSLDAIEYIRSDSLQQEQPEMDLYNNGWIDCAKQMPKETKQWSDTMQGHREWTESDRVLVWDSIYGCGVDATKNGKWISEQRGGYTGQVVHGIIAWRPIPEFNEELLFNARKEKRK